MKTLYSACLSRLGLSRSEAAKLHGVRIDTINSWATGRRPVPEGAWDDLRQREDLIIERAETIRELWEDAGEPKEISAKWDSDVALLGLADFILGGHWDDNAPIPQ
ncbi:hypothetical protein D6851_02655 [Altericroceibacterium spongiae]|uniref:Uncharacterized protein n=1 Tax=Altericroceibacterium spongiae TaxID=2320269 RepID=A0A420ERY7_9SPHN|nr:hypothetical protein [Altericroceibacterium spongiae]RKF23390.1 hypothetical protein D6851_02655 [Altericroceibacterium spongiae]